MNVCQFKLIQILSKWATLLTGVRHVIIRKLEGLQTSVKPQLIIFIRAKL